MEDTKIYHSASVRRVTAILLGKSGTDKALIGNTMAGVEHFEPETSECKPVKYHVDGQMCDIVNTPDLYHGPKLNSEENEIPQTKLSFSGERVFLLILQHDKISPEEINMFAKLKETYGKSIVNKMIVVLDISKNKTSAAEVDKNIQSIIDECGGSVCNFNRDMKKDELNDQLLSTYKRMLQRNVPDRLVTTSVDSTDKTSENESSQPESAGEKPGAAEEKMQSVHTEKKTQPCAQDILARSKQTKKRLQMNSAQPEVKSLPAVPDRRKEENIGQYETMVISNRTTLAEEPENKNIQSKTTGEKACAVVSEVKMEEHKMYKITDESKVKPLAAVPEGKRVEDTKFEIRSNPSTLAKEPEDKKTQSKPTEEMAGATVLEVANDNIYETIEESNMKSVAAMPEAKEKEDRSNIPKMKDPPTPTERQQVQPHTGMKVLTIVLLGQTGSGKSATGNTILGRRKFESHASSTAVTQQCGAADGLVCGIRVRVIDTPDFFDEDLKNPEFHIQSCRDLSQVQPVVYLLVMHMGRFTEGEREAVSKIQKEFGPQVTKQTIVLFTGSEKLREMSLPDYIKNADPQLQHLVQTFGSRYHAFNNNDKRHHQVKELVKILLNMPIGESLKEQYNKYKAEQKECTVL